MRDTFGQQVLSETLTFVVTIGRRVFFCFYESMSFRALLEALLETRATVINNINNSYYLLSK